MKGYEPTCFNIRSVDYAEDNAGISDAAEIPFTQHRPCHDRSINGYVRWRPLPGTNPIFDMRECPSPAAMKIAAVGTTIVNGTIGMIEAQSIVCPITAHPFHARGQTEEQRKARQAENNSTQKPPHRALLNRLIMPMQIQELFHGSTSSNMINWTLCHAKLNTGVGKNATSFMGITTYAHTNRAIYTPSFLKSVQKCTKVSNARRGQRKGRRPGCPEAVSRPRITPHVHAGLGEE